MDLTSSTHTFSSQTFPLLLSKIIIGGYPRRKCLKEVLVVSISSPLLLALWWVLSGLFNGVLIIGCQKKSECT